MNRNTLIALAVGLVVGLLIGLKAPSLLGTDRGAEPAFGGGSVPQMPPQMAGDNFQARIAQTQAVLARDPKNVAAWVQLGNDYFDTRQPQKAIDAYARALELEPNNPDVLTDQGVMYRDLGDFERAAANFRKANEISPKHIQSLFNLGVVYGDLKQPAKAAEAWRKVIAIAPDSQQAADARNQLAKLDAKK